MFFLLFILLSTLLTPQNHNDYDFSNKKRPTEFTSYEIKINLFYRNPHTTFSWGWYRGFFYHSNMFWFYCNPHYYSDPFWFYYNPYLSFIYYFPPPYYNHYYHFYWNRSRYFWFNNYWTYQKHLFKIHWNYQYVLTHHNKYGTYYGPRKSTGSTTQNSYNKKNRQYGRPKRDVIDYQRTTKRISDYNSPKEAARIISNTKRERTPIIYRDERNIRRDNNKRGVSPSNRIVREVNDRRINRSVSNIQERRPPSSSNIQERRPPLSPQRDVRRNTERINIAPPTNRRGNNDQLRKR